MNNLLSSIPELRHDLSNFDDFKTVLENALAFGTPGNRRALEVGPGEGVTEDEDRQVKAIIVLKAPKHLRDMLSEHASAKAAFDLLKSLRNSNTNANKNRLLSDLHRLDWQPGDTVTKLVSRGRGIWSKLRDAGEHVSEFQLVNSVLNALPSAFDVIKTILISKDVELNLPGVLPQLLREEQRVMRDGDVDMVPEVGTALMGRRSCTQSWKRD